MKKAFISSIVIIAALALSACSFGNKSVKIETDEYDFDEEIENIEISISYEDLHIMESDDDEYHVVFSHLDDMKTTVEVKGDKLVISEKTYRGLGIFSDDAKDAKLDIYLPKGEVENIKIDVASSDVVLTNIVADTIDINTASGDITFEDSDAEEIDVDSASGDVAGTLLSGKVFDVDTVSGKVNVPNDSKGGKCDIDTASGDVDLKVV